MISHFFISSDNLEGKNFLDFVSVQKKIKLGASFVKVNKKRVKKRCLESFLKNKDFENNTLVFEREGFLKNVFNYGNTFFFKLFFFIFLFKIYKKN
jgi:phosphotransferase system IIA component